MEYPPEKTKSKRRPNLKLEKASPEQLKEAEEQIRALEQESGTQEHTIEHKAFSAPDYRSEANALLDELKAGLDSSGLSPMEVGKQWAALKIAHSKLLETTGQYRSARNEKEREELEQSIRLQMGELRGGGVRDEFDAARADKIVAQPKKRASLRQRNRLNQDSLKDFDTVLGSTMQAEAAAHLDTLSERDFTLRTRLEELDGLAVEGREAKRVAAEKDAVLAELADIERQQRLVEVPNIKTESVRAGIFADADSDTPKGRRDDLRAAVEASRDVSADTADQPEDTEWSDAARIYQSGDGYMDSVQKSTGPRSLSPEEQEAMAKRFSSEEAARTYQSGAFAHEAVDTTSEPAPAAESEPAEPEVEPKREDDGPIVMVNPVLRSIAHGKQFRRGETEGTSKKQKKEAKKGSPKRTVVGYNAMSFDNPNAGKEALSAMAAGAAASAVAAPPAEKKPGFATRAKSFFLGSKRRKIATATGGAGVGILGAALLALFAGNGKKEEVKVVPPTQPAAARPAAEAGVSVPAAPQSSETPAPVTVPSPERVRKPEVAVAIKRAVQEKRMSDDDAKMIMAWETMAYRSAKQALPPESDKNILKVRDIISSNRENPYAFKGVRWTSEVASVVSPAVEPVPAAPEAAAPQEAVAEKPKLYSLNEGGQAILAVVGGKGPAAFEAAQRYAETLPAGSVVRFEAAKVNPVNGETEPLRGAFQSDGTGRTHPILSDPASKQPFAPIDRTKLTQPRELPGEVLAHSGQ